LVRVPVHWRTHEIDTARSVQSLALTHGRGKSRGISQDKSLASCVRSRP
jgi:hypothetical protein